MVESKLLTLLVQVLLLKGVLSSINFQGNEQFMTDLKSSFGSNKEIPHHISNFGFVDYQGAKTRAKLVRWPGKTYCSLDLDQTEISSQINSQIVDSKVAFFFKHSPDCTPLKQADLAKQLSASFILIALQMGEIADSVSNLEVKSSISGTYPAASILTFEIGDVIDNHLNSADDIFAEVDYHSSGKFYGKLHSYLTYSPANKYSVDILKGIVEVFPFFATISDLQLVFNVESSNSLGLTSEEQISKQCLKGGHYCSKDDKNSDGVVMESPKEVLLEGAKQVCMSRVAYFNTELSRALSAYLDNYKSICFTDSHPFSCGSTLSTEFSSTLQSTQKQSYEACILNVDNLQFTKNNGNFTIPLLEEIKSQASSLPSNNPIPSFYINGIKLSGTLTTLSILSALCDRIANPPIECNNIEEKIQMLRPDLSPSDKSRIGEAAGYGLATTCLLVCLCVIAWMLIVVCGRRAYARAVLTGAGDNSTPAGLFEDEGKVTHVYTMVGNKKGGEI